MTGLRERIEAERAALLDERAIAEAATPGPWEVDEDWGGSRIDATGPESMVIYDEGGHGPDDAAHIARQNPAATIDRIDRELARIDADLALLDTYDRSGGSPVAGMPYFWLRAALDNMTARYPEEDA